MLASLPFLAASGHCFGSGKNSLALKHVFRFSPSLCPSARWRIKAFRSQMSLCLFLPPFFYFLSGIPVPTDLRLCRDRNGSSDSAFSLCCSPIAFIKDSLFLCPCITSSRFSEWWVCSGCSLFVVGFRQGLLRLQAIDACFVAFSGRFGALLRGRKKLASAQTRFPLFPLRCAPPLGGASKPFALKCPSASSCRLFFS
jgi:hypothetical protein